ncbi:MAG: hypothetical protein WC690_03245 [bacterium]
MPFELNRFDVMEHLWDTLEKTPDGRHILYTDIDIDQLWWMGFVDTDQIGLEEWKALFEHLRQADGTYLLGKDDFLALDRYRYKGEIRIPFDPMLINEGKYTDEGFDTLVNASIAPSSRLSRDELAKFVNDLKKDFRQPDGLVLIKKPAKQRIKALLDDTPSPLRNLEILMDQMIVAKGADAEAMIEEAEVGAAAMEAARQASHFAAKPTTRTEQKAAGLKALEKARQTKISQEIEGAPKTELKKIRRSRKGMRG